MGEKERMGKEETQAIGRFLGWLSKKAPDLYEKLIEEAESRGIKPHELIREAIWFYLIDLKSKEVGADISQHLASLDFWLRIEEQLVERRINQLMLFFNQFFQLYTDMIQSIVNKIEEGRVGKIADAKVKLIDQITENINEIFNLLRSNMSIKK